MARVIVLEAVALYFIIGIVALGLLDLTTGRIRRQLKEASIETQTRLVHTGQFVGTRTAVLLTLGALWLFWWLAIYSAIVSQLRGVK